MAESEIYSNPQRLLLLADELRIFNNDLRIEIEKMNEGLHHLGATWQDEEFKKFKQTLDKLKEEFAKLDQDISKREPELKADAQLLRDYLNKTIN
jgi:peptidoglycan hydrolase CwlO-like protein